MTPGGTPTIYTIPAGRSFVDCLVDGLLNEAGDDPMAVAEVLVLLPNRRSCRALREAFLRVAGGRPLLLPDLRPLGEVDEDELLVADTLSDGGVDLPPAVSPVRRRLLLADLIQHHAPEPIAADQAIGLASDLARLLDQVQIERLDFARLAGLVPDRYAVHWQKTLGFLQLLTDRWPERLAAEGWLDPADRRNRLLEAQTRNWQNEPPSRRIIAAGSTGSIPAAADLLEVVARLPRGAVVLPGLDRHLDADSRGAAGEDPTHPQFGMLRLLARMAVPPDSVPDWTGGPADSPATEARRTLVTEIMRPASTTEAWRDLSILDAAALDGIERVDCVHESEEAKVIALALREALRTEGVTAALVTPDRGLARRVAAELLRWGLEIDDSAGLPLDQTPPGVFLRLVAEMAEQRFPPVATLAALKHPLAACGLGRDNFRAAVRRWEQLCLRGPRPPAGLVGLRRSVPNNLVSDQREAVERLLDRLDAALSDFERAMSRPDAPFSDLLDAHIRAAEAIAAEADAPGFGRLWAGEAGEALAEFIAETRESSDVVGAIEPSAYPAALTALMSDRMVRPRHGRHPRLHIWGPLEARLQRADFVVLGGLNEGSWPREPDPDPWLSRPMQAEFGLPLPERRIGLSAHDFAVAACSTRVLLTRAEKAQGTPTVPSRWLSRLRAVLEATGNDPGVGRLTQWQYWQALLDRPQASRRIAPPAPRPPVRARPRRLSVTRIESWMRDPYSIFARHILGLKALDPLEADPTAADRGTVIHEALDRFIREAKDDLPEDAEARLLAIGKEQFRSVLAHPVVHAFWWPRFERVARWFIAQERARRPEIEESFTEVRGEIMLPAAVGDFVLTAHADRIDRLRGGGYAVLDYKTGQPPSQKDLRNGYAPQLPLEAAIAAAGGFGCLPPAPVHALSFWRLSGGAPPGEIRSVSADLTELIGSAMAGLQMLVDVFDHETTPYAAVPDPAKAPRYNDYAHLARIAEWAGLQGEEGR